LVRQIAKKALDSPEIADSLLPHSVQSQPPKIMKSKKNLTRFSYETAAFEGWRLNISRAGSSFTRYFPDKKFGGPKKALKELKALIEGSKRVDGKLSATTIRKAEKLLMEAV
jgi:hypothetical protein